MLIPFSQLADLLHEVLTHQNVHAPPPTAQTNGSCIVLQGLIYQQHCADCRAEKNESYTSFMFFATSCTLILKSGPYTDSWPKSGSKFPRILPDFRIWLQQTTTGCFQLPYNDRLPFLSGSIFIGKHLVRPPRAKE